MRSKYRAKPTIVDGVRFASQAEARHYAELKLREKAGEIKNLELQPKFPLMVSGQKVGTYIADFRYREGPKGVLRVVDVKGYDLPLGKWKRKHTEAQYGITITLVKR
jgi:hypothetical protein